MGRVAKRILIRKNLAGDLELEGSFESIRNELAHYEDAYPEYSLSVERYRTYNDYDSESWQLHGERLENDKEYKARLAKNEVAREKAKEQRKNDKLKKEDYDKALYEKLKKKFEG